MNNINIDNSIFAKDLLNIIYLMQHSGYEAYLVGGCVRDMLMGNKPHDFDICTSATPAETIKVLESNNYKHTDIGIKYGTVVAINNTNEYEITTYRSDCSYSDGRHPDSVVFAASIDDDLSRRDFTMNAIAYDPFSKKYIDKFNGRKDIENNTIRCIGNANKRFDEDALRILRCIRFAIKYQFSIDNSTSIAMISNKEKLSSVSKERVTAELIKMLECNKPVIEIFLKYADIICYILPEIRMSIGYKQHNLYHQHDVFEHTLHVIDNCDTTDYVIKLAALFHDIGKPYCAQFDTKGYCHFIGHPVISKEKTVEILKNDLVMNNEDSTSILALVENHDREIAMTEKSIKRVLSDIGEVDTRRLIVLKSADRRDHINIRGHEFDEAKATELVNKIIADNQCFKKSDLAINGNDVMNILKIKPGKEVGDILNKLFDKVINEEIANNKDELTAELERSINE